VAVSASRPHQVARAAPFTSPEELERILGRPFELRLGANESAFGPSRRALSATVRELARASWYPDPASRELTDAVATARALPPSQIVVGAGIDDLLDFATSRLLRRGETAVTTAGTYPIFEHLVRAHGGRLATVPYRADMTVDLAALAELANRADARIVYVANPDNPTGSSLPDGVLRDFADALPNGCALLLDQAYVEFAGYAGAAADVASGASHPARLARFYTFSKAHGLAGLRIGYAVVGSELAQTLAEPPMHVRVTRLAQAAALAALGDVDHLRWVVREVERGRDEYAALGPRLGWAPLPSRANFVTFRVGSARSASEWVRALARHGVFVRRGFTDPLDSCVRVTVGTADARAKFARIAGRISAAHSHWPRS
jgi:histidinol-phosphate aminotransferase